MKTKSVFYTPATLETIRANLGEPIRQKKADAAAWWMGKSYDELWALMFAPTLKRSWMVLSGGECPACGGPVPMYDWRIDAQNAPWKVTCPHCGEQFPKNDFGAYYQSGLDEHGVFRYEHALANLLRNDSGDGRPKNALIDDGNGYLSEDGRRMMFIGTYLVYGQWRQLVVRGIERLGEAYAATGEPEYARRALLLLDRVADLFPFFDYREQGVMYEGERNTAGYVSYWVEGCIEVRSMAVAYDRIFDAVREDRVIADYLHAQAVRHKLENDKSTFSQIQKNIEERIFRDAIVHKDKITMNFPHTEVTLLTVEAVLGWPENAPELREAAGRMIEKATAVDGVTGEKGTCAYGSIGPAALAEFFSFFSMLDPQLPVRVLDEYPGLVDTFRFHLDTWCVERYYPGCGDMGGVGFPVGRLGSSIIHPNPKSVQLSPCVESFFRLLWQRTGDVNFARAIYLSHGRTAEGCFTADPTLSDGPAREAELAEAIRRVGPELTQQSVNKKNWHLAILRSGEGKNRRCAWISYDSGGQHGHDNALNIGLVARGLDLLPDFGYPPVNYGGWDTPEFHWYRMPASHNLVVIDGRRHVNTSERLPRYGECTLWDIGETCRAGYFRAPEYAGVDRYERLYALIDVSDEDCYAFDVFRVLGGRSHARFVRSTFSTLSCTGLRTEPGEPYGHGTFMRNFRHDAAPQAGWSADFEARDVFRVLEPGERVRLRYIGLTEDAGVDVCESWIDQTNVLRERGRTVAEAFGRDGPSAWLPTVMETRRSDGDGLFSAFCGLYVPYGDECPILSARRVPLTDAQGRPASSGHVGAAVTLKNGATDILIARDPADPQDVYYGRYGSDGKDFAFYRAEPSL